MSEIYLSKEPELQLQVIPDSNDMSSLLLELLKLTVVWQALFLLKEICSSPERGRCICKQGKITDTKISSKQKLKSKPDLQGKYLPSKGKTGQDPDTRGESSVHPWQTGGEFYPEDTLTTGDVRHF